MHRTGLALWLPLALAAVFGGTADAAAIEWRTDSGRVRLDAGALVIEAGGRTFTAADADVTVHGDPGDGLYWTLEAEWFENGRPMRLYLYFTSDGTDWWVTAIRTYDGTAGGDWIVYDGEFFRTPLDEPYAGVLELADRERGCSLRLTDLRIEVAP